MLQSQSKEFLNLNNVEITFILPRRRRWGTTINICNSRISILFLSLSAFLVLVVEIKKKKMWNSKCLSWFTSHFVLLLLVRDRERRGFLIAHCKTEKPFGKSERIWKMALINNKQSSYWVIIQIPTTILTIF